MLNKYLVKKVSSDIEPHEVFLDKLAHLKEEELGISEKKFEVPLKEKISYVLFVLFVALSFVLLLKLFYFQIIDGKKLAIAAENNRGSSLLIIPERGIIYDKNLKKLVSNSAAFDLVCQRGIFTFASDNVFSKIESIAALAGVDSNEIFNKIQASLDSEVLLAENLSHERLLVLEAKINEMDGCRIQQKTARNYLLNSGLSQIIGYTGRINEEEYTRTRGYMLNDYIGKAGTERYYEEFLRGKPGYLKQNKTAMGKERGAEVVLQPEPGNNLVLNIDAGLQQKIYESLEKSIKNIGSQKGAAVAIDPRNGAVLAMVSYPTYDNNLFSGGISLEDYNKIQNDPNQPLFNRVTQGQYPTGSTIKPFEAAGALQEKLISPLKKINDIGYIEVRSKYDGSVVYRFGGVKPHGWVDMRDAIAVSSNIYFYTIGGGYGGQSGLGPQRIKKYLELFGWGSPTGIDLPGEAGGLVPSPDWKKENLNEQWWDGDTYNFSIGQSYLKVTPLQVAVAYSAIANGGTLYVPQILNRVVGPLESSVNPIKQFEPKVIRENFIDSENIKIIQEGMKNCVDKSYGSCASLNSLSVNVAAKTGTAEIGQENFFNAWVSAYAPYENPEIVFVATIEGVEGLRSATLPVAKEVLEYYFSK